METKFTFRAECRSDLFELLNRITDSELVKVSFEHCQMKGVAMADINVTLTLKCSPDSLKKVLADVPDSHVMLRTLGWQYSREDIATALKAGERLVGYRNPAHRVG